MGDIRVALRMLRKSPGFTIVAVLTLALGIGANTAIFSIIDNVLLSPLPYPDSRELVTVANTVQERPAGASIIEVQEFREQSGAFAEVAATLQFPGNLTGGDLPARIEGLCVSPSYFAMLRVPPRLGRTFVATDETPGISPVTVISEALWQSRFGGTPDVIGRVVQLDDDPYTIIGVMPAGFRHPAPATSVPIDIYVPCGYKGMPFVGAASRETRYLAMIARLAPGMSVDGAQERLAVVAARLHETHRKEYPESDRWGIAVRPLAALVVGDAGRGLLFLFGAVGLVLLIACTNVAILLMARAARRQKELTVRAALGASRLRLVRQLFTESAVLAVLGGAGGVALAAWATDLFVAVSPIALPRAAEVRVDLGVLAFTLAVSLLTALLFGLLPALWASRTDLQGVLNAAGRSIAGGGGRLRTMLVVAEVALATVMLVNAGLLLRSLHSAQTVEPGFDPAGLASVQLWQPLPNDRNRGYYNDSANRVTFATELLRRVRAIPGVESAALAAGLPLAQTLATAPTVPYFVVGRDEPAVAPIAVASTVSEGYFATMGIALVAGRAFAVTDGPKAPRAVIVNRSFATRAWPGGEAVGAHLRIGRGAVGQDGQPNDWTVVGVVADVRSVGLDVEAPIELYIPYAQNPTPQIDVVVRTAAGARRVAASVPQAVRAIDQNLPVSAVRPFDELLAGAVARRAFVALLVALFAAAALTMAALGIYSVTSYGVAQRRHEIGVRMAVGARSGDVLRMILGESARVVGVAVLLGLAGALASGRLVAGLLYDVRAVDPLTFAAIAVLLGGVALLASWLPARRAAKVDPMISLRSEV